MTNAPASPSRPDAPNPPGQPSAAREIVDILRTVGAALLLAMGLQSVAFQPYTIPSSSMEPGLVTGDYVVASKYPYGWSRASLPFDPPLGSVRLFGRDPARGDVVLFRLPRDRQEVWVKRLIGLPGDRVQVRDGQVFVNGRGVPRADAGMVQDHDDPVWRVQQVRETLADGRTWLTYDRGPGSPGDDTPILVVPAGHYLMMGDNRDNSLDGRFSPDLGVGLLPADHVIGRAEIVVASWRPGAGLWKPWTWFNLQPGRFFKPVR